MLKDFKVFIMRGNVVDMAVGVIIGAAFGTIVSSLVTDVVMPPVGLALGKIDFASLAVIIKQGSTPGPYPTLAAAQAAGAVTLNYGLFINTIINFLVIASAAFFFVVRPIARMKPIKKVTAPASPMTKECPFCCTGISVKATRCPHCTSQIPS